MDQIKPKNSLGIWAFGANSTRFMPDGYHKELKNLSTAQKIELVAEKLGNIVDGLEYHYPGEINFDNLTEITNKSKNIFDIYIIALGFHSMPEFAQGAFTNPDKEKREKALRLAKEAVDLCAKTGAKLNIWSGGEGYNYAFQINYIDSWNWLINGMSEIAEYALSKNVKIFLEHKNSEPAMKVLADNIGMTLFLIKKISDKNINTDHILINMDWNHLIMNKEFLPEYASLLINENKMGHQHANSGWGTFDDDNIPGTMNFMEILGLAKVLQEHKYGYNGERIGFDIFPYTENVFEAVKQSILQWEFIASIAEKIDNKTFIQAQKNNDAITCYKAVYEALGMNKSFINNVLSRKK